MMEEDFEPTSRIQTAELQGLVTATMPSDRQRHRITAEMPVAHLNDLLELVPREPPTAVTTTAWWFHADVIAAFFSVAFSLVIVFWFVIR